MNCHDCQAWLQRRLNGESLAPTADVEQHWSACVACREQYAAALQLLDGLKRLPRPKPSHGAAQAIVAAALQDRRERVAKMRRRVFVTLALAASVALLMIVGYLMLPTPTQNQPQPKPHFVEVPKKIEPPKQEAVPEKPEPRHALTALTDRWVDATRDHAKVVIAATQLDVVEKLPMDGLPPGLDAAGVREASQEVTEGVRAVTRNARRAFNFIARELPMPELGAPDN